MAKEHSSVLQARADDADEAMRAASLVSVQARLESARDAWQGLADGARERESEDAQRAEAKAAVSQA
ncbi:hypothetical protein [Aurantimonas sp. 22II-16-19i]|uniref:hypothetical protein n=1 Tax=Aurantimonas sp. 22II-16-19i TaxID=1317114 RepID=UPI0009F7C193|nr:hypothetical protein [Aurantimonas sp. 22II-16-19i]ORE92719.1 hypothetical protein ATO4_16870 [Aurantimonas sp. 22II-16-19i]